MIKPDDSRPARSTDGRPTPDREPRPRLARGTRNELPRLTLHATSIDLEAVPDAVLVISPSGDIVAMNRVAERLLGYDRRELCGVSRSEEHTSELQSQSN